MTRPTNGQTTFPRGTAAGLVLVLLLATLGEGGSAPTAMRYWHAALAALLLTVLLAGFRTTASGRRGVSGGPAVGLALYACWALVGALRTPGYSAWLQLLELAAFLAVLALAARCGAGLLAWLGPALLLGGAAQAALVWAGNWGGARPSGTFLNANHLAGWLGAGMLLVFGELLIRREPSRRRTVATLLIGLPIAVAFVTTGSRGATIGVAAGGAMLAALTWSRLGRNRRWLVLAAGMMIVAAGASIVALRAGEADPFRYQRVKIWRASVQTALDHPWFGSGPRQFALEARNLQFPDGDAPLRYDRGFRTTHSDLLRVPCELGWPAAAAGLFFVVALGWRLRRRHREATMVDAEYAALAALAALAAQSLVDNLSQRPGLYLLAAALIGAVASAEVPRSVRLDRKLRLTLAVLLVTVFLVGDEAPYRAWRSLEGEPTSRSTLATIREAMRLNPAHPEYARRLAMALAGDGSAWDPTTYALAREAAERAVRLSPRDADGYWTLAQIEELACRTLFRDRGSRERARASYERAEALSRYNTIIPLTLARFLLDTGAATGARRAAERAMKLEPEAALPRLVLAEALLVGADPAVEQARRLIAEAEERVARWSEHPVRGDYADRLLRPAADRFSRVRALLEARSVPG